MTGRLLMCVLVALAACAAGGCQLHPHVVEASADLPPTAPSPALPYRVSEMRVQTVPAMTYLYSSTRTNFDELAEPASLAISTLKQLSVSGRVQSLGSILFIYHDPSEDPAEYFDVEMGLPVPEKTSPPAGFSLRMLPAFHCARMIYHGPLALLPHAYDKLIRLMIAANLVPSEETRENYLVWEDAESLNNVIRIEVGIR